MRSWGGELPSWSLQLLVNFLQKVTLSSIWWRWNHLSIACLNRTIRSIELWSGSSCRRRHFPRLTVNTRIEVHSVVVVVDTRCDNSIGLITTLRLIHCGIFVELLLVIELGWFCLDSCFYWFRLICWIFMKLLFVVCYWNWLRSLYIFYWLRTS